MFTTHHEQLWVCLHSQAFFRTGMEHGPLRVKRSDRSLGIKSLKQGLSIKKCEFYFFPPGSLIRLTDQGLNNFFISKPSNLTIIPSTLHVNDEGKLRRVARCMLRVTCSYISQFCTIRKLIT